jgi:hypothetical protein
MTEKQKKQYKKELYTYLDFEYDDLTTINKLIKASQDENLEIENILFAYVLGLVTAQYETTASLLFEDHNEIDNDLLLRLNAEASLAWVAKFLDKKDKKTVS